MIYTHLSVGSSSCQQDGVLSSSMLSLWAKTALPLRDVSSDQACVAPIKQQELQKEAPKNTASRQHLAHSCSSKTFPFTFSFLGNFFAYSWELKKK